MVLPKKNHILRPHHIFLLYVMHVGILPLDETQLPPPFTLHLHRVVLQEVAEVSIPRSFAQMLSEIKRGPQADRPAVREFIAALKKTHSYVCTPELLTTFFQTLPILFIDKEDEESARYSKRSIFGYFVRRCFVSFSKLSFSGVEQLHIDYLEWLMIPSKAGGTTTATPGYAQRRTDILGNDYQLFKTMADKREYPATEAYSEFHKHAAVGDIHVAGEKLREFFEQRFHEGNDSGLRQLAMLNLARAHYLRQEWIACKKILEEAVVAARTGGDNLILQHASSLLHRMPPMEMGRKTVINEIQPDMHPLEVLWDAKKLLQVPHQQPVTAAYEKVIQAIGLYDHYLEQQGGVFVESEQLAQHAAQSLIWTLFGCNQLARIEENVVTAYSDVGGIDNTRLIISLNRAYAVAREGNYASAIASLLEPDVWRGISIDDYTLWADEIWHILALRASRRGQRRQFTDYLEPRKPRAPLLTREYWFSGDQPLSSMIREPLYDALQMRKGGHAHACVDQLLTGLWHAEFQCRFALYRTALVLLADVGLEFGLTRWCKRMVEEVMPQIMSENDSEQKGFACFVLARCIIACGDSSADALRESLDYLKIAEDSYAKIEAFSALQDVQFLRSVVYHNLDMVPERDTAAREHQATREANRAANVLVVEEWIEEVWAIVTDVGAALMGRA